jgi:hypothetical protein
MTISPRERVPSRALLNVAWDVALRYRAHDSYGSEENACRALSRRCPGCTPLRYRRAFRKAVALYDRAEKLVNAHRETLWRRWQALQTTNASLDTRFIVDALKERIPGFSASVYSQAVGWVFFWHHLK